MYNADQHPPNEPPNHPGRAADAATPVTDEGLYCPHCGYNLTGLLRLRCPECGRPFDHAALLRTAGEKPPIAFERARGRRKIAAFVVTWITVLLLPWVFARQVTRRCDLRHGLAFLAVCYAGAAGGHSLKFGSASPLDFWGSATAWLLTATIYLMLQSVLLTFLDPHARRAPGAAIRHWWMVGCYTSAIMLTEWYTGPPLLAFTTSLHYLRLEVSWALGWDVEALKDTFFLWPVLPK